MNDFCKKSQETARALRKLFDPTPLQRNDYLSVLYEADIWLKREDLSPVRSYKLRGAFNAMRKFLANAPSQTHFVCASAGNHAQGVAFTCNLLGIKGDIYVPLKTPLQKINKIKYFGKDNIRIHLHGTNFNESLNKAIEISRENDIETKSIVFPRNQINQKYLKVCEDMGLTSYRGVESSFFQKPRSQKKLRFLHRVFRFMDSYINISGSNSYKINAKGNFINLPASFFFRPFSRKLFFIEKFKLIRLKNAMTEAARKGEVIHLWWHPHNHGTNTEKNMHQLELLLKHFNKLKLKYNMLSYNMSEISDNVKR